MTPEAQPASPFRIPIFRALWVAALVSNLGSWMHSVGAAWLLTDLSRSPGVIALLAAASALPVFVLSLPAGALADVVDRRKLLLVTQTWMFVVAGLFAAMAALDRSTPALVLVLTGLLAVGSALNMPAWSAITPELVRRAHSSGERSRRAAASRSPARSLRSRCSDRSRCWRSRASGSTPRARSMSRQASGPSRTSCSIRIRTTVRSWC